MTWAWPATPERLASLAAPLQSWQGRRPTHKPATFLADKPERDRVVRAVHGDSHRESVRMASTKRKLPVPVLRGSE